MVTSYIYLKTTYTCYGYKKNNKLLIQFQLAKAGNLIVAKMQSQLCQVFLMFILLYFLE